MTISIIDLSYEIESLRNTNSALDCQYTLQKQYSTDKDYLAAIGITACGVCGWYYCMCYCHECGGRECVCKEAEAYFANLYRGCTEDCYDEDEEVCEECDGPECDGDHADTSWSRGPKQEVVLSEEHCYTCGVVYRGDNYDCECRIW